MCGVIPLLPPYTSMASCSVKHINFIFMNGKFLEIVTSSYLFQPAKMSDEF
jgi:hypothetical protein